MGYAILRIDRIKTDKQFNDSFKHNERIYNVTNADPDKRDENVEYVDREGKTYKDLYDEEIRKRRAEGAITRAIRKDAVRGLEIVMRFSREDIPNIDIDEWAKANVDWLNDTFNPPDHTISYKDPETGEMKESKTNNVKSVVLHMDEQVPHLHAFVVPIAENGHLNYGYYTGSTRSQLQQLQDSYARAMEPFGLRRGELHSVATPEQLSRYYSNITKVVDAELPQVREHESAEEYRERANDSYQTMQSVWNDRLVKKNQEMVAAKSENYATKGALLAMARAEGKDRINEASTHRMISDAKEKRDLDRAIMEHPDRDAAMQLQDQMDAFLRFIREQDYRKREEKEERGETYDR